MMRFSTCGRPCRSPWKPGGSSRPWGFEYKSQFVWDKEIPATALRVRNQHELLYVATRGRFPAPLAKSVSVIRAPKRGHSEKPDEVYEMIERDFPGLPKIELFARARRDGWAAWGNEIANEPD
jgi:N6-adenosine-specific RNA methylase IME4